MTTSFNGQAVTVTAPGTYLMSELRDEAALRFAEELARPVDWPTLADVIETPDGAFVATYTLAGV